MAISAIWKDPLIKQSQSWWIVVILRTLQHSLLFSPHLHSFFQDILKGQCYYYLLFHFKNLTIFYLFKCANFGCNFCKFFVTICKRSHETGYTLSTSVLGSPFRVFRRKRLMKIYISLCYLILCFNTYWVSLNDFRQGKI